MLLDDQHNLPRHPHRPPSKRARLHGRLVPELPRRRVLDAALLMGVFPLATRAASAHGAFRQRVGSRVRAWCVAAPCGLSCARGTTLASWREVVLEVCVC
jgi:hypothetical protein